MMLHRVNPQGRAYSLTAYGSKKTQICTGTKSIDVNVDIDTLSQAWYNWQMKGELIQNAFSMLSAEEREFLITGLTPSEWKEIFAETEED